MKTYFTIITLCSLITWSSFSDASEKDADNGKKYACSRIIIDGEREWMESKRVPGTYNIPNSRTGHRFDDLLNMEECVRSFCEDGNISGIRGAFLMAYVAASIPHRSGDVMSSYGDPLFKLLDHLGDEQFSLCLSKMRPEVQSAVFYLMFFTHWPMPGQDKEWDERVKSTWPYTYALLKTIKRLKWPHDFER